MDKERTGDHNVQHVDPMYREGINYNIPEDSSKDIDDKVLEKELKDIVYTIKEYMMRIDEKKNMLDRIQEYKERLKGTAVLKSDKYLNLTFSKDDTIFMLNQLGEQYQKEINKYYKLIDNAIRHYCLIS